MPWLYAAPLEWALVFILVASGVRFAIDPKYLPASIAHLEWPWSLLFHVMVMSAGILIAAGLLRGPHRWSFGLEAVGFTIAAGVFLTYFGGLLEQLGEAEGAWFSMLTNLAIGCALIVKVRALQIESKNRLLLIRQLQVRETRE